jgi:ribosomal protein S18 acetylase RimI-like enzyme
MSYFKDSIVNNITLVATIDDNIVGYMTWNLNSQYSYNTVKQAELNNMCIIDEYRKLWIGTKLITEFKKICKDNNIQEIKVIASYENINAINFYKKNGFNESELTLKIKI